MEVGVPTHYQQVVWNQHSSGHDTLFFFWAKELPQSRQECHCTNNLSKWLFQCLVCLFKLAFLPVHIRYTHSCYQIQGIFLINVWPSVQNTTSKFKCFTKYRIRRTRTPYLWTIEAVSSCPFTKQISNLFLFNGQTFYHFRSLSNVHLKDKRIICTWRMVFRRCGACCHFTYVAFCCWVQDCLILLSFDQNTICICSMLLRWCSATSHLTVLPLCCWACNCLLSWTILLSFVLFVCCSFGPQRLLGVTSVCCCTVNEKKTRWPQASAEEIAVKHGAHEWKAYHIRQTKKNRPRERVGIEMANSRIHHWNSSCAFADVPFADGVVNESPELKNVGVKFEWVQNFAWFALKDPDCRLVVHLLWELLIELVVLVLVSVLLSAVLVSVLLSSLLVSVLLFAVLVSVLLFAVFVSVLLSAVFVSVLLSAVLVSVLLSSVLVSVLPSAVTFLKDSAENKQKLSWEWQPHENKISWLPVFVLPT